MLVSKAILDEEKNKEIQIYRGLVNENEMLYVPAGALVLERTVGTGNVLGLRTSSVDHVNAEHFKTYIEDTLVRKHDAALKPFLESVAAHMKIKLQAPSASAAETERSAPADTNKPPAAPAPAETDKTPAVSQPMKKEVPPAPAQDSADSATTAE